MEEQVKAEINLCERVRADCRAVSKIAQDIVINQQEIKQFCKGFDKVTYVEWKDCHFDHKDIETQQLLSFIFVVDSLNFCFWPTDKFEYDDMVRNLKKLMDKNGQFFSSKGLQQTDINLLKQEIFGDNQFALLKERTLILKNVGEVIQDKYQGSFLKFVQSCNNSAVQLVNLIYQSFDGFRDKIEISQIIQKPQDCKYQLTSIDLYFLKRAQILTADIFAALSERNEQQINKIFGQYEIFPDIGELTMFPDYRVPQILRSLKILQYSQELSKIVDQKVQIQKGSWKEVQIRAQTVEAVERIKQCFKETRNIQISSIQLDWYLWQEGEKRLNELQPHHHTMTIFY